MQEDTRKICRWWRYRANITSGEVGLETITWTKNCQFCKLIGQKWCIDQSYHSMLKALDWSRVACALIAWFLGGLVLTTFWPDFSQQSLISSKDKSRDDLQQNLQISVNAISVLLSNENYTSNELNALLIGEGGLIQDWFKDSQDELPGTKKCVGWVGFREPKSV